jgi:hypothetical protein
VATWQGMTWQRELFGPGLDAYDPYASVRSDRPAPPQAPAGLPPLAPLPTAAQPIVQRVQPPAPSRSDQATRLAQDIAYGHSDWERAGQAVLGSGKFEDASGLRRAGAVAGGVALGTLALASWIPGFNVFKPAQAARAARAFSQGAATGARAGTGIVRSGMDEARTLEQSRRAQKAADKAARAAPAEPPGPRLAPTANAPLTPLGHNVVDPIAGQPVPIGQLDSGVHWALRSDPLFADLPVPVFQITPQPDPASLRGVGSLGTGYLPSNIWHAINGLERAGIYIPQSLKQDLVGKYSQSFLSVSQENLLRNSRLPRRLLEQIDELGQWDLAAETLGRPGLYTPRGGIAQVPLDSMGLHGAYGQALELDDIAKALLMRARQYAEGSNAIVVDSVIEDLLRAGASIPLDARLGFNTRHLESFSDVISQVPLQNVIAVPIEKLDDLLLSGVFYNQFMTLSSRGILSPKNRVISELATNGIFPSAGPLSRPVYGYAAIDDAATYAQFIDSLDFVARKALGAMPSGPSDSILQVGKGAVNHYGGAHFVFSPQSAHRSAFTLGDSLNAQVVSSPLQRPSAGQISLAGNNFGLGPEPYIETQTIAPQFKDIVHVRLSMSLSASELANLKAKLRTIAGTDVPVSIEPPRRYGQ